MPIRTCIHCRMTAEKSQLVRVVFKDEGMVVDNQQIMSGRGSYVHPVCFESAIRKKDFGRVRRHRSRKD